MLLGFAVLGERLRVGQCIAVALAGAGVLNLAISYGAFPWLALALALSFAVYGLLRKIVAADSLEGLFVETLLVCPSRWAWRSGTRRAAPACSATVLWHRSAAGARRAGDRDSAALVRERRETAAARRPRLLPVHQSDDAAPAGVLLYREPFTKAHLVTFALIWTAIALYSLEAVRAQRAAVAAI